MSSHGEVFMKK